MALNDQAKCTRCGSTLEVFNTDDAYPHRVHKSWMCDAAVLNAYGHQQVKVACKSIVEMLRAKGHEEAASLVENRNKESEGKKACP